MDYSNREIDAMFDGLHDRLTDQDKKLDVILAQVKATNGRVNSLENWKWLMIGGMSIISMMVIPLVIYIFNNGQEKVVKQSIEDALSAYEIKVEE